MFNVGGGELLVILLIALIVLGPQKLPEAAKQIGGFARELRRMSDSFQNELKHALDEPIENEARDRGRTVVSSEQKPAPSAEASADETDVGETDTEADDAPAEAVNGDESATAGPESDDSGADTATEVEPSPPMSTAEAAGMYDLMPTDGSSEPGATTQAEPDQDGAEVTDELGS
jgi:sec-independent protein translocase protein TatB